MVTPVDQRNLHRRASKPEGGFKSAEPGADNHHTMSFWRVWRFTRHLTALSIDRSAYVA